MFSFVSLSLPSILHVLFFLSFLFSIYIYIFFFYYFFLVLFFSFFFFFFFFFFQAEDGIRDGRVTGVQTCALPIYRPGGAPWLSRCSRSCSQVARRVRTSRRRRRHARTAISCMRPVRLWRSEERRVGKECRSRWSPDH